MRKTLVTVEIPTAEVTALGLLAAQQGIPAAEVVRNAVSTLDNQTVVKLVTHALEQPASDEKPITTHTGMYFDPQAVTLIDQFARKLLSTRNKVINLIIRGILSGVVR